MRAVNVLRKIISTYYYVVYRFFHKELYREDFLIVFTNLLIAFKEKYNLRAYFRITRTVLKNRIVVLTEEYFNNLVVNIGVFQFVLLKIYLTVKASSSFLAKSYCRWFLKRSERIKKDPKKLWKSFFKYYHRFQIDDIHHLDRALEGGKGALLCAFHLGYYRVLPDYITSLGYPLKILVDRNVYNKEFARTEKRLAAKREILGIKPFEFIIAEDVTIAMKILKSLNNNEVILFYLDGNTGVGSNQKKSDIVPFLSQALYIRKGAVQLALKNGTPILPILSLWKPNMQPGFRVYSPIIYPDQMLTGENASEVGRALYKFFENIIQNDPVQWDQWFDCHRFWVREKPANTFVSEEEYYHQLDRVREYFTIQQRKKVKINKYRMGYMKGKEGIAIVDIHSARFFEAPPFLNEFIPYLDKCGSIKIKEIRKKWLSRFSENHILEDLTRLAMMDYIIFS